MAKPADSSVCTGQRKRLGASEALILAVSRRRVRADEGRSGRPKKPGAVCWRDFWGAPLLLLGAYYTLLSGFALYGLPLDLILYALAMAGGFALAWHLQRARLPAWLCGVLVIAAGVYGASLALFSFAPPDLPIFTPPV